MIWKGFTRMQVSFMVAVLGSYECDWWENTVSNILSQVAESVK